MGKGLEKIPCHFLMLIFKRDNMEFTLYCSLSLGKYSIRIVQFSLCVYVHDAWDIMLWMPCFYKHNIFFFFFTHNRSNHMVCTFHEYTHKKNLYKLRHHSFILAKEKKPFFYLNTKDDNSYERDRVGLCMILRWFFYVGYFELRFTSRTQYSLDDNSRWFCIFYEFFCLFISCCRCTIPKSDCLRKRNK